MASSDSAEFALHSRRRWFLRRLGIVAGVICALLIVALIAIHTPPARRYLRDQAVALLASEQIEFSADQLGYNVLSASVDLRNVRVRSTTWPDAPVFATLGRVHINLSLLQLLRRRYVVQSGTVDDVDVHYFVDEQGRNNVPRPPADPNEPRRPLDYLVSALEITRAHVRYENRAQRIDAQLPLSSIEVDGSDLTDRHDIRFDAARGDVRVGERQAVIDRLAGLVDLGEDDVSIERLELDTSGSHAALTGTIKQFGAPVADLILKSKVDTMRVATVAGIQEQVSGSVTIDATAKGPLSTPAIAAHVSGSGLQFRDLRDALLDANASYDLATRRAAFSSLQVRGPWGGIMGEGNIAVGGGSERSRVRADINNIDAATIMRGLRLPLAAAAHVNGRLQAEWPGRDYLKARGTADAVLRPTASEMARSSMPIGGRIVARGTGSRVDAQLLRLAVPGGEVSGRVAVTSHRHLEGAIRGRSADVGRLTSSVEAFTGRPRGSLLPMPISGAAEVNATLAGSIDAPTAATTLDAPALKVGAAEGIALNTEATYASRAIVVSRARISWQSASAHVNGRIGLGPNQPVDLKLSAESLELRSLLQAMNKGGAPVSGTLAADGSVVGTTTRPLAMITVQGVNLAAYEEQIGSLNADIRLDGRELTVTELVVDKPHPDRPGRLTATATYDLDRRNYSFDLQSRGLRLDGLQLPNGQRVRGDVQQLTARGAGNLNSPEGTVNLTVDSLAIESPQASASDEQNSTRTSELGRVVIMAQAMNNEATITASSERFNLTADALVGLARPWPATVKMHADKLDLAALPHRVASEKVSSALTGLEGQLRATIDASGDLAVPEKGRVTIAVESLEGMWNGRPFMVASPSPIHYADERLTVDTLEVVASDTALTVTGNLPLTDEAAPGEINVNLHGNLTEIAQYLPKETNISAGGAFELTGSLRGTLKRIDPDLMLTVDSGLILSPTLEPGFSNINLRARVEKGEARIERLTANWGPASLEAAGHLPLDLLPQLPVEIPRMSGPATFKAAFLGLDPSTIPGVPPQLSGRISAEAEVAAADANVESIKGQIVFRELDVAFSGLDLVQQQASTITIESGAAQIEQLNLSGSAGEIHASGSVGLVGDRALTVDVDGGINVAAVTLLTDRIRAEGDSALKLMVQGTLAKPEVTGTVELVNASVASDEPNVAAVNINAHVDLEGSRVVLSRLDADVNGGTLKASGEVTLGEGMLRAIALDVSAMDIAYDAPLDLRSISDSNIKVTNNGEEIVISGVVTIEEGGLTGDIDFDTGLLAAMTAHRKLDLTEERNPTLERIRFNIDVNTATPIIVDNNLARAEVEADLTVVGTPYETGLLGELMLLEGSEIRLNERRYETERGTIAFSDERRIVPSVDLLLKTTAGIYDITIAVTGTPGDTETTLTSSPTLPEPDIMAVLVTGRTLDQMRGEEYEVARAQVLSYLAGGVGSSISRGLQQATGLSEVRIEPMLIASEADPSARLTVGQDLTDELKLVYSTNLTDSNDQIWVAEYDVTHRFQTRAVRQADNSYRLDFRHDVRFGGQPEPRRAQRMKPVIAAVAVNVPAGVDEAVVRKEFGIEAGDDYDFFDIRNGTQRVEQLLVGQGYLQSRVRLTRGVEAGQAHLTLTVTTGPKVDVLFPGAEPPGKVVEEVRTQWHRGVFDKQRADAGADRLREWLMDDNYLQARVDYEIQNVSDLERRVTFRIQLGTRSSKVVLAFEGASGIAPDDLDKIVEQQRLERKLVTDPFVVTELLERYYRDQGYLSAEIDEPRREFQGSLARVVLTVREGARFNARNVTVAGNTVYPTGVLIPQLPVIAGQPFAPAAAENALEKIRDLYWSKGYNDIRSDYDLMIDRAAGQVDVAFSIREGRQSVIAGVTIEGNEKVSENLVRRQIELMDAQPLDLSALARSRRNLYNTGAFSLVDITRKEVDAQPNPPAPEDAARKSVSSDGAQPSQQKTVEINVAVREVQPIQIRYGGSYDTERGVGGIFEISNHNSLGNAREIGLRSRYDRQGHEGRIYFNQPELSYFPKTTGAIYLHKELNPPTELTNPFDFNRRGVSIQQERQLRDRYVITYGYKLERAHTLTPLGDSTTIDEAVTVSPLIATLIRETRDEVLDAARGAFLSYSFQFSPGWLGSDQPYTKSLGQYFHYFPLRPPTRRPFTNEIIRPRLVYATGVRIGLSQGLGGPVPRSERFYAGGSATLRGFAPNTVGPIGPNRIPTGGQAMLVLNNELRFPLVSILDGVTFVDIGNVFATMRDFSLTDLRYSTGIGLRVRTPWVLLRGDYGIVLDPRPGESRGRFYFSIGQAF